MITELLVLMEYRKLLYTDINQCIGRVVWMLKAQMATSPEEAKIVDFQKACDLIDKSESANIKNL